MHTVVLAGTAFQMKLKKKILSHHFFKLKIKVKIFEFEEELSFF